MSGVDWTGIRAAIAASCATAPSIREATHLKLGGVGKLPAVKVTEIESIVIDDDRGGRSGLNFEARRAVIKGELILPKPSDIGRTLVDLETCIEELFVVARGATGHGFLLGMSTVVRDSWLEQAEVGDMDYGEHYPGADLTWIVLIDEKAITRVPGT